MAKGGGGGGGKSKTGSAPARVKQARNKALITVDKAGSRKQKLLQAFNQSFGRRKNAIGKRLRRLSGIGET